MMLRKKLFAQLIVLLTTLFTGLLGLWQFYHKHLQYIILDNKQLAVLFNEPFIFQTLSPTLFSMVFFVASGLFVWLFKRRKWFHTWLKIFFIMCLLFCFWLILSIINSQYLQHLHLNRTLLYQSENFFVEAEIDNVKIHNQPRLNAKVILKMNKGDIYLLVDSKIIKKHNWNKILVGMEQYGWVLRKEPQKNGANRLVYTGKYHFTQGDGVVVGIATVISLLMILIFPFLRLKF